MSKTQRARRPAPPKQASASPAEPEPPADPTDSDSPSSALAVSEAEQSAATDSAESAAIASDASAGTDPEPSAASESAPPVGSEREEAAVIAPEKSVAVDQPTPPDPPRAEESAAVVEPGGADGGELAEADQAVPIAVPLAAVELGGIGDAATAWAIDARELVKTYRGRRRGDPPVEAVRGLSLQVPPGTIFGLLGPNGAGKSTTVRMLATLSRPDSGSAIVAGHDLLRRPWDVRRSIGIVPQKTGADLDATGRENLLLQGRLYGLGGAALARRADDLLDRFDLAEAGGRLARTYSGGMLRRLDVAIGLVQRPTVLFLDEPTTGLDPQARAVMWSEIAALTADGLTILLTTHYLEEADRLASRVAIVEGGRVVVEGSPNELKSELRGDAVDVDLAAEPTEDQAEKLRARLAALPGVVEVAFDGRVVRTRVDEGAASLRAIFAAVDGAGLVAAAATVARPSLDDVYLRHVGHRLGRREEVVA